jgi:glyoxylase-like metal-dependent hydrolase (beta-lactamase superfamily II)
VKSTNASAYSLQLTRYGFVNCYLLREPGGGEPESFTLIDAGLPGTEDDILAAADAAGTPIRRILLTHAHMDHVGSVDVLMSKLSARGIAAELASNDRSLPLLKQPPDSSLVDGEPSGKIKGGLPGIKLVPDRLLAADELYGSLRVIETPGHSPGHLSFLDERDGTLYAGDALIGMGKLAISGFAPWYFPLPNFATWNKQVAFASARKLLDYRISRFACGHGAVREGGIAALQTAIREANL